NTDIEINSTTVGTGYDRVAVTGTANLDGTLNVTLGTTPNNSDTFTIMTMSSRVGTFSNTPGNLLTLSGVGTFNVTYNTTSVVLGNFTPVPEPTTVLALLAPALAG